LRRILAGPITQEKPMRTLYTKFAKDNAGVTAIEYGLIAALVAVVCIAAWSVLGTHLSSTFSTIAATV
jgi:pilus assembly protein Flp/PilA